MGEAERVSHVFVKRIHADMDGNNKYVALAPTHEVARISNGITVYKCIAS